MIYEGPRLVRRILEGLLEKMKNDGFDKVEDVIGGGTDENVHQGAYFGSFSVPFCPLDYGASPFLSSGSPLWGFRSTEPQHWRTLS